MDITPLQHPQMKKSLQIFMKLCSSATCVIIYAQYVFVL
jgi:hypothetical protein